MASFKAVGKIVSGSANVHVSSDNPPGAEVIAGRGKVPAPAFGCDTGNSVEIILGTAQVRRIAKCGTALTYLGTWSGGAADELEGGVEGPGCAFAFFVELDAVGSIAPGGFGGGGGWVAFG